MKKTIAILILEDPIDFNLGKYMLRRLTSKWRQRGVINNNKYLLIHMASIWKQQGFNVKIIQGVRKKIKADLVFSHINLTVVPDKYTELLDNHSIVINHKATDISKSLISQNLLMQGDSYDGPVIVKTVTNYGGAPETKYLRNLISTQKESSTKDTWRNISRLNSHDYPRFNSIDNVPRGVWKNNNLIVDKFLPEIDASGNYCLREWVFLGDKEFGTYTTHNDPIIKYFGKNSKIISEVPDELRIMRDRLGVDFGRIDYAIVNGKTVIYDVNTTPTIGNTGRALFGNHYSELATGIRHYLNS